LTIPLPVNTMTNIQEKADNLYKDVEILAPMVRASTTPLRILALKYGADTVYTEEIIDRSIIECERVENKALGTVDYLRKIDKYSKKQLKKLYKNATSKHNIRPVILRLVPEIERGKLVYQLGTGNSNLALQAAQLVERDIDAIDINMGCPKQFSTSGGMGSELLKDVERACDIVRTLRRNLSIPVSCKIRLLKSTEETIDFVKALQRAGANAITIHAREVGDESTTRAKWDRLEPIVSAISVPAIVNGDMYSRKDIEEFKEMAGADSVMLARPALYNTSIFQKQSDALPKHEVIQEYLRESLRWQTNYANVKYVVCEMMNNRRAPHEFLHRLPQKYPGRQTIQTVCACGKIEDLCKLWDVNVSVSETVAATRNVAPIERVYDDRYFTAPTELKDELHRKNAGSSATVAAKDGHDIGGKVQSDTSGRDLRKIEIKRQRVD